MTDTQKTTEIFNNVNPERDWADFLKSVKMKIFSIMRIKDLNTKKLSEIIGVEQGDLEEVLDISEDIYLSSLYDILKSINVNIEIKFNEELIIDTEYQDITNKYIESNPSYCDIRVKKYEMDMK